jgi:hypothetical protein
VAPVGIAGVGIDLLSPGARPVLTRTSPNEVVRPTSGLATVVRRGTRIATRCPLPEPEADEGLLLTALGRAVSVRMTAWHDDADSWDEPIPTPIRSTWDGIHDAVGSFARADRAVVRCLRASVAQA